MSVMIDVKALTKRFGGFTAVDGISLSVREGEVLGFLGPNGAGKSTTMKMIAGFLTPTDGTAEVCGFDVQTHPKDVKAAMGYMPEGAPSYGDMTCKSFLNFIAQMRGLKGQDKRDRIDEVVDSVHLEEVWHRPIDVLSKGYRRRVALAQAILHDPDVLILDEPTDGLDPNQKHDVRALIQEMAPHKAIIVSTHILEEVEAVCSRAVIIGHGSLLADGTAEELKAKAQGSGRVNMIIDPEHSAKAALALKEAGIPIAGLEPEGGSLDDAFRAITSGGSR